MAPAAQSNGPTSVSGETTTDETTANDQKANLNGVGNTATIPSDPQEKSLRSILDALLNSDGTAKVKPDLPPGWDRQSALKRLSEHLVLIDSAIASKTKGLEQIESQLGTIRSSTSQATATNGCPAKLVDAPAKVVSVTKASAGTSPQHTARRSAERQSRENQAAGPTPALATTSTTASASKRHTSPTAASPRVTNIVRDASAPAVRSVSQPPTSEGGARRVVATTVSPIPSAAGAAPQTALPFAGTSAPVVRAVSPAPQWHHYSRAASPGGLVQQPGGLGSSSPQLLQTRQHPQQQLQRLSSAPVGHGFPRSGQNSNVNIALGSQRAVSPSPTVGGVSILTSSATGYRVVSPSPAARSPSSGPPGVAHSNAMFVRSAVPSSQGSTVVRDNSPLRRAGHTTNSAVTPRSNVQASALSASSIHGNRFAAVVQNPSATTNPSWSPPLSSTSSQTAVSRFVLVSTSPNEAQRGGRPMTPRRPTSRPPPGVSAAAGAGCAARFSAQGSPRQVPVQQIQLSTSSS
eukprot:TRINITY_DN106_c1_g1_i1.p1 TRINITY_DN106_c1_g1~~TRINITY_DN106_c1_g1_i1.p1  ORF type:complete len:550 (+),score=82.26 TRINITY_DN106_c1_g1_i1:91-1650(+)